MICQAYFPSLALKPYVHSYQLRHFTSLNGQKLPFKPYAPRAEQTLVFYPRGFEIVEHPFSKQEFKRPRSMVTGQYTERTNRHLATPDFIVILVHFLPGVLHRITGIPYFELTNTFVDAEAIFGSEITRVNERLNSTDSYPEMFVIIEKYLHLLIQGTKADSVIIDRVAQLIIDQPENSTILEKARESFLCVRQFERKFKERMGISPKTFSNIARMNKAFRLKYNCPEKDWLDIALSCGYHDYQHMAKHFQMFTLNTPPLYLKEDNNAPERYFGLRDSSM
jgi:AraC-like DNA-binding protein